MNQFDICLGIFGDSAKADDVVPNKVFHYANALGQCIISKDTPTIRGVFIPNENIKLGTNEPNAIIDAIGHDEGRLKIGSQAKKA